MREGKNGDQIDRQNSKLLMTVYVSPEWTQNKKETSNKWIEFAILLVRYEKRNEKNGKLSRKSMCQPFLLHALMTKNKKKEKESKRRRIHEDFSLGFIFFCQWIDGIIIHLILWSQYWSIETCFVFLRLLFFSLSLSIIQEENVLNATIAFSLVRSHFNYKTW